MREPRNTNRKHRLNADEVKGVLVRVLRARGVRTRTEWRIRGVYGVYPADVAVLNDAGQLVTVAEAKVRTDDLRIKQRTNYATCGVPAFLCCEANIRVIANAMAAYVLRGEQPSGRLLINGQTWASDSPQNNQVRRRQVGAQFLRG